MSKILKVTDDGYTVSECGTDKLCIACGLTEHLGCGYVRLEGLTTEEVPLRVQEVLDELRAHPCIPSPEAASEPLPEISTEVLEGVS